MIGTCKLKTCRQRFEKRTPWQHFHSAKCRDAYHNHARYALVKQAKRQRRRLKEAL